jgi:hypothetical protein
VHERWDYDDATGVQALRRLLALCRGCHASTHYGLAEVQGRDGEAFAIGIILVVIGVILAILAAPHPPSPVGATSSETRDSLTRRGTGPTFDPGPPAHRHRPGLAAALRRSWPPLHDLATLTQIPDTGLNQIRTGMAECIVSRRATRSVDYSN